MESGETYGRAGGWEAPGLVGASLSRLPGPAWFLVTSVCVSGLTNPAPMSHGSGSCVCLSGASACPAVK